MKTKGNIYIYTSEREMTPYLYGEKTHRMIDFSSETVETRMRADFHQKLLCNSYELLEEKK